MTQNKHCMKSIRFRSFSGPYFSALGTNTDQKNSKYGHFSRSEEKFNIYFPLVFHWNIQNFTVKDQAWFLAAILYSFEIFQKYPNFPNRMAVMEFNSVKLQPARKNCPEVVCKKGVLKNFAELTRKHLCLKPRLWHRCLFSCEFWEIFKNTFLCNASGVCFWPLHPC